MGEHPSDIQKAFERHPEIGARVRALIDGPVDFGRELSVGGKIFKDGNYVIVKGCPPHMCGVMFTAIVFDVENNVIHVRRGTEEDFEIRSENDSLVPPFLREPSI